MPRQARIDAPGALHHIICRGIERRNIFKDNTDRNRFLERLGLNPIRAEIVKDLKSLDRYAYTGHSIIMGKRKNPGEWGQTLICAFIADIFCCTLYVS